MKRHNLIKFITITAIISNLFSINTFADVKKDYVSGDETHKIWYTDENYTESTSVKRKYMFSDISKLLEEIFGKDIRQKEETETPTIPEKTETPTISEKTETPTTPEAPTTSTIYDAPEANTNTENTTDVGLDLTGPLVPQIPTIPLVPQTPPIPEVPSVPTIPNLEGKPLVALTFDDGPHSVNTNKILDALEKNNARATFFVMGNRVEANANTIKRAITLGCEIGNHTYNHKSLTGLSIDGINAEIDKTDSAMLNFVGSETTLIRPPYGAFNQKVKSTLDKPIVIWSIDTMDWKTRNSNSTFDHVMQNVKDGDIILMHDIYSESADAAVRIINELTQKGYGVVTVSELSNLKGKQLTTGIAYGSIR